MARAVVFPLVADPREFNRGFDVADRRISRFSRDNRRHFDRGGDDAGQRFGLRFNKRLGAGFSASTRIARTAASGIAGAFAAVQVAGFLKGAIDEAREAQRVGRQTAAVIKATGGAARVSAQDVEQLASSLSRKVGVDDEVIQAGANMLLTFKLVRNEVGKGNDIFNQASATILDMTAAMHQGEVSQQGLEKATIQVGKALNDPIKGITALTRVGVTFTQGQKDQIEALVESGRRMEAQRIILAELKSEFGGAAKAAADPWQRVVVAFKNVQEAIGLKLLPKINDLFTFLEKNLVPKLGGLKRAWDDNKDSILSLLSPFDKVNDKSQTADERAQSLADSLTTLTKGLGNAARFLNRLGGHLNDLQASLDVTAKAIHTKFVRPAVASFLGLVRNWLAGMHTILRITASTAEALRLPWARNLRRIERDTRSALNDVQHRIDQLHGKTVTVKARAAVEIARSTRLYLRAANVPGFRAKGGLTRLGETAIVGEEGPELVQFKRPAYVYTAAETRLIRGRGMAAGGPVGDMDLWNARVVTATERIGERFASRLASGIGRGLSSALRRAVGTLGGLSGPGGWRWQMAVLRRAFPGLALISGFRPGAITATGNRSYHALGRAVDVPPRMDVFNFIRGTYGRRTRELIFSPAGGRQVWNGRPHMFTGITRANHWNHVHWAYGNGGLIPEDVFGMGRSGRTYGFHGGETVTPPGGIDIDALARAIARELAKVIPTRVAVDDIHTGLLGKRNRNRLALGLD